MSVQFTQDRSVRTNLHAPSPDRATVSLEGDDFEGNLFPYQFGEQSISGMHESSQGRAASEPALTHTTPDKVRSSAEKFFNRSPTPLSPNRSCLHIFQAARSLDESASVLTSDQVKKVIELHKRDFHFPHYTFDNTPTCRTGLVSLIQDALKTEFNVENVNRFTVLTWISPSVKKGFIDETVSEHKTAFYVQRTEQNTFIILSLDSIEGHSTRRLIQVVREDLSEIAVELILHGWASSPVRQRSYYGCGAFTLDDILRCHKFPNLLEEILKLPKIDFGLDHKITLPPEFMVSTQSFTTLSEYLDTIKEVYPPTHQKVAMLYNAVFNSTVVSPEGRGFNKYIEARNEQFHQLCDAPSLPQLSNVSFSADPRLA